MTLIICPEHAHEMHDAGLSKADVRRYVYENARMPVDSLRGIAHWGNKNWPSWVDESNPDTMVRWCPIQKTWRCSLRAGTDATRRGWPVGA